MGKKNKKKMAKKKNAKALKQRTRKKQLKKHAPKRRMQLPNMPGGMSGGMPGAAQNLMVFAEPLVSMAQPESQADMMVISEVIKGFWTVFSEKDLQKRETQLNLLRGSYESMPWATVDFDALCDNLLKRHIHLLPATHSQEEIDAYSAEDIAAALEWDPTEQPAADPSELAEALDAIEFDSSKAPAIAGEMQYEMITGLHQSLLGSYQDADFINPDNPIVNDILLFQNQLLTLYGKFLADSGRDEATVAAAQANLKPLFDPFLREYQSAGILTMTGEHLEEYVMDFFLRKVDDDTKNEASLLTDVASFIMLAHQLGFISNAAELLQTLQDVQEEYLEITDQTD